MHKNLKIKNKIRVLPGRSTFHVRWARAVVVKAQSKNIVVLVIKQMNCAKLHTVTDPWTPIVRLRYKMNFASLSFLLAIVFAQEDDLSYLTPDMIPIKQVFWNLNLIDFFQHFQSLSIDSSLVNVPEAGATNEWLININKQ